MITPLVRQSLEKQGYKLIGSHSGVKLCRWTKVCSLIIIIIIIIIIIMNFCVLIFNLFYEPLALDLAVTLCLVKFCLSFIYNSSNNNNNNVCIIIVIIIIIINVCVLIFKLFCGPLHWT